MDNDRDDSPTLELVGFRIEPDIFEAQLYSIYVEGDQPILKNGQPIVFTSPKLAKAALAECDCESVRNAKVPEELQYVFDFTEAISYICEEDEVPHGGPLDCINLLLDVVNCTGEIMPASYRAALESLANHMTFSKDVKSFFERGGVSREEVSDAIYWALGMAVYRMKIIWG